MNDTTSAITLAIAVLGAVLGILNYWRAVVRDSYRIRVIPKQWISVHERGLCIEVINMGNFDVTVSEVGIALKGTNRLALHVCYTTSTKLPVQLEARTAITIYADPAVDSDPRLAYGHKAYAKTACGKTFRGTSPYLKQVIRSHGSA